MHAYLVWILNGTKQGGVCGFLKGDPNDQHGRQDKLIEHNDSTAILYRNAIDRSNVCGIVRTKELGGHASINNMQLHCW